MKELLKKLLEKLNSLTLSDAEKADLKSQIEAIEKVVPAPKEPDKRTTEPDNSIVAELRSMITAQSEQVKQLTDALAKETKAREDGAKALQDQQKAATEKKITDFLDKNKTRIPPAEVDDYKKKLFGDFDGYSKIIEKLPEDPAMKKADDKGKPSDKKPTSLLTGTSNPDLLKNVKEFAQVSDN